MENDSRRFRAVDEWANSFAANYFVEGSYFSAKAQSLPPTKGEAIPR